MTMLFKSEAVKIDLTGKVALVTGGTRGIGKAIAQKFIVAGAYVIVTGTKNKSHPQLLKDFATKNIEFCCVDFSNEISTATFLKKVKQYKRIDILVNNAGINKINLNTDTTLQDFTLLTDVNLKAPYVLMREVSKKMKKNKAGKMLNITSIWSEVTKKGRSIYTATKYGLAGLTKTLAVELAAENILVNSLGPGFVETELTLRTNSKIELKKITELIPLQRLAQPDEIANIALFLCSDLNSYITGQNIIADGGYSNI